MVSKTPRKPIEIKISTVVAIAVIVHDADLSVINSALKELTANSSDYYSEECAVIDVANIDCAALNWAEFISIFKVNGINAIAVRNAPADAEEHIIQLGLSIDLGGNPSKIAELATPEPEPEPAPAQVAAPAPAPTIINNAPAAMIIDTPVRGGQRIYARGTDLIITAVVNAGAEVIADGSIHVYAPLRGRALAGASGNTSARIFAMSLEAELVSIAGIYRTFENGYPKLAANTPLQIKLNGDRIDVVSIQSHN
ncbi:septum site-determining protein MinC [Sapientia aquatica]|uniref:Probable septum site-determining protein MinC n=1 Tax=Sapientia aquatica TaxID=1549640 RepID=A0A4R5W0A6_9BURK|nr:septum site-determining protein MinC [Sapientia aquatica]TDK65298.1 septum site-determining protein MinC [Sapientia aquatica]